MRYVVVQTPVQTPVSARGWRHYLSGWHGDVPTWSSQRDDALKLDEQVALRFIDVLDARYRRVVCHYIEELS